MRIVLTETTKSLGVTPRDVEHMLAAIGRTIMPELYAPTLSEVYDLMKKASAAEAAKNRRVQKWEEVMSKLK